MGKNLQTYKQQRIHNKNMKIKLLFFFGLLLASAWAEGNVVDAESVSDPEKVSEPEKVIAAEAKAEVNLGDLKCDDENVDKKVDENVEETENGVSASASASVSYNLDYGKWLKEYFAKWCEASQQKEETNEENKEADNEENEENSNEEIKSPFSFSFNVHSRASASAKASSSASSSFCIKPVETEDNNEEEIQPQENVEQPTDAPITEVQEQSCNQQEPVTDISADEAEN